MQTRLEEELTRTTPPPTAAHGPTLETSHSPAGRYVTQHLQPLGRIQRPTALAEVQMRVDLQQEEEDVAQENAQHHAFEVGGVHQPVEKEDEPWSTGEYQMR